LSGDLFVEQKEEGGLIEMDFPQGNEILKFLNIFCTQRINPERFL
jgi:hypothetical protein